MADMVAEAIHKVRAKTACVHAGAQREVETVRELV